MRIQVSTVNTNSVFPETSHFSKSKLLSLISRESHFKVWMIKVTMKMIQEMIQKCSSLNVAKSHVVCISLLGIPMALNLTVPILYNMYSHAIIGLSEIFQMAFS